MLKKNRAAYTAAVLILIILLIATSLVNGVSGGARIARAATETVQAYESRNVMDDLKNATIDGKPIDLSVYNFDESKNVQLISFVEFGYSFRKDKQDDYGLYVYVYNPRGLDWTKDESLNKITFKYGSNSIFIKPRLKYLNRSTAAGQEGLFYKFKVTLADEAKEAMLNLLKSEARTYEVSEIELYHTGANATAYGITNTYTYRGFAEGYGSESATSDTLRCTVDGFDTFINLEVKHTTYRAEGDYYNGEQSQLDSCYFRVPNVFFNDYGELTEIACEWYEYFTKPILTTEDSYIYSKINGLHGKDTATLPDDTYVLFNAYWENLKSSWVGIRTGESSWSSNYGYKPGDKYKFGFMGADSETFSDMQFSNFAAAFYTNGESYKDYIVGSDEVKAKLLSNSNVLGGPYIHGTYSSALFEDYVQDGRTYGYNYKKIKATDEHDIFWNYTTRDLWQKMFTGTQHVDTVHDSLKAIITLSDDDLKGSDETIAERLKVSERDIGSIKQEHERAKRNDETVILFRFSSTSYFCAPGASSYCGKNAIYGGKTLAKENWNKWYAKKFNCSISQETVYLSFDIISLTFSKDGVDTVIPVVMSPIDIVSELTPPLTPVYDDLIFDWDSLFGSKNKVKWWTWVIIGLAVVVVLWIVIAIIKKPTSKVKIVQEKGNAEEKARQKHSKKKKRK